MKKTGVILAFILALLLSIIFGIQTVDITHAQFFGHPIIWADTPNPNEIYTNTSIPLNIHAIVHIEAPNIEYFLYNVDENPNATLTNINKTKVGIHPQEEGYEFTTTSILKNLTEGNHTLNVYSVNTSGEWMSYSVEFMVDTNFKSPLLVLSPQNKTYTTNEVDLTFTCTEEVRFADYQLNGKGDPLYGNFTLSMLSSGEHKLLVVVWTVKGVFSQTIYFSVSKPDPFPTTLVLASVVIIGIVAVGILAYYKKKWKHR